MRALMMPNRSEQCLGVSAQERVIVMSLCNDALVDLIRGRLMQDSRVAALAIDVRSSDGFVCLRGVVDTPEQKELAVHIVTGLIGVRNVKDELTVSLGKAVGKGAAASNTWTAA